MVGKEKAYAADHDAMPARVCMYVGEYEEKRPGDARLAKTYNMITDARNMERAMKSRKFRSLSMRLDVLNDEDHVSVAPRDFTHGLKYLLPAQTR